MNIIDRLEEKELVKRSTGEKLGRITLCIGVAHLAPGDCRQSLVERAERCLLAAQRAGRNQVVSEPGPAVAPREQAATA